MPICLKDYLMTTPIICISEHLRLDKNTSCVAKALTDALDGLGIPHEELKSTNDYWVRDFMPINLFKEGVYVKYRYCPDYLRDYKSKRRYITDPSVACANLDLFLHADLDVIFDGGNYVRCGDKVIMTDKIFMENPYYPPHELLELLTYKLCADIVLLPWDMKDPCGHADGMVAPLDDGRLLLNNYVQNRTQKNFYKRLRKILDAHFDVVDLSYNCALDPDSWCYLNFLNLPNAILLPTLSEHFNCENDQEAIKVMMNLFPDKQIVPVYAKPLIFQGGALHCVTWEYVPNMLDRNEDLLPTN